jgi:hypothetical protein
MAESTQAKSKKQGKFSTGRGRICPRELHGRIKKQKAVEIHYWAGKNLSAGTSLTDWADADLIHLWK